MNFEKIITPSLVILLICFVWLAVGIMVGSRLEKTRFITEKQYIYKNKCFTIYNGAVMSYDCQDSTIESKQ